MGLWQTPKFAAMADARNTGALALLGQEANGLAVDFINGTMVIRDTATPANNFDGDFRAKLTVTGTLTPTNDGTYFDATNNASLALTAMPSVQSAVTVMAEYMLTSVTGTLRIALSLDDGTTNEFHWLSATNTTTNKPVYSVQDGAVAQVSLTNLFSAYSAGTVARVAGASSLNSANAAFNGAIHGADDTTITMPTPTTLRFGIRNGAIAPVNGYLRKVLVLPRRMTNAELTAISAL